MIQSSSYCFTNTNPCRARDFPYHPFPKLSARPSPLQFIKSNRRPHIVLGWLQYTNYAIPELQLHCRVNNGYLSSYLNPNEASMRGTFIATQCRWWHFVKGCASVQVPPFIITVSCSSVEPLPRRATLSSLYFTWEKKNADRLKIEMKYKNLGKTFCCLNIDGLYRWTETMCLGNKTSSGLLYCSYKFRQ